MPPARTWGHAVMCPAPIVYLRRSRAAVRAHTQYMCRYRPKCSRSIWPLLHLRNAVTVRHSKRKSHAIGGIRLSLIPPSLIPRDQAHWSWNATERHSDHQQCSAHKSCQRYFYIRWLPSRSPLCALIEKYVFIPRTSGYLRSKFDTNHVQFYTTL